MNNFEFIGMLWIFGSIGNFYIAFYSLSSNRTYSLGSIMETLMGFENQYFLLFFFSTSYFLIEYGLQILDAEINNGV